MTAPNATNFRKKVYEHLAGRPLGTDINSGDFVYYNTSAHTYDKCDDDTKALTFAGVSNDTSPIPSLLEDIATIRVNRHGTFEFTATCGQTYYDGTVVYVNGAAQTISNTGTHVIGLAVLETGVSALTVTTVGAKLQVAIIPVHLAGV